MATEKIGTREWITIRSGGNRLYLPLSRDLINAFDLKKGDQVFVEIKELNRLVETREYKPGEELP